MYMKYNCINVLMYLCMWCFLQHLGGDLAFSDVYELKEEVAQTATSVCRRCLHRVTSVEYSVKVVCNIIKLAVQ